MSETKNEEALLATLLVAKGYSEEDAMRSVVDVMQARRDARDQYLKRYLKTRTRAEFGGLLFDVIVEDVRINVRGRTEFQVTPLNGVKSVWVDKISN